MPTPPRNRAHDNFRGVFKAQSWLGWALPFAVGGGLLLAGFFIGWPYLTTRQFEQSSSWYEDREQGFSFRYPKTWELIPKQDLEYRNEKFVVGVYTPTVPSTAVGVIVEPRREGAVYESRSLARDIEATLSATLTDFTMLKRRPIKRNGIVGTEIQYTFKHSSKNLVRQQQRVLVGKERIYYLSGTTLAKNFGTYQKEFKQIFRSLTVK